MEVKWAWGHDLPDGGRVDYYRVGDWSFDYIQDADGVPDMESDANLEHSKRAVESWTAWVEFLESGGPESEVDG